MTLPDPETTEAEAVEVDDDEVIDNIPDDNPFKETIVELNESGKTWMEVWELLEDVYNPVDQTAYKENQVKIPEYRIRAVVPDEKSTSGEAYEEFVDARATKEEVIEWVREKPEVIRIESAEKVGTVTIA